MNADEMIEGMIEDGTPAVVHLAATTLFVPDGILRGTLVSIGETNIVFLAPDGAKFKILRIPLTSIIYMEFNPSDLETL
jgi:hypothetical protein